MCDVKMPLQVYTDSMCFQVEAEKTQKENYIYI